MSSGKFIQMIFASAHFVVRSLGKLFAWLRAGSSPGYVPTFKIEGD